MLKPFIQDGRLRALAVTTAQRNKSMPDVPTMAEAGITGYDFTAWAGLAAPAGTPKPIIDRIYGEIAKVLATRETQDWFESFGSRPAARRRRSSPSLCVSNTQDWARSFASWASRPSRDERL